jgi:mannose-6-phosphate isomerase
MSALYPLMFYPVFRQYLWGGRRLETILGKQLGPGDHYAESWEVVDHGPDQSVVSNGPLRGITLGEIRRAHPEALLGRHAQLDKFPLLFKFLDAQEHLSIQVHPDDEAARRLNPPDAGKTEAWVVLAVEPGSRIYAGLKPGCTPQQLRDALASKRLLECLHSFTPQPEDVVFIPAGVVHALGAGLLVAEIQQSSDTTFRLYDWDRLGPDGKPRPLHIEQALSVVNFQYGPVHPIRSVVGDSQGREQLVHCDQFCLDRWRLSTSVRWGEDERFHILSVLEGRVEAQGAHLPETLQRGQTILLPACAHVVLTPSPGATLLDMYLP